MSEHPPRLDILDEIDTTLDALPPELRARWQRETANLPPEEALAKLRAVASARSQAVNHGSVHFSAEAERDPVLHEKIEHLIVQFEQSRGDQALYLGEGNVAEVYRANYDPKICIKFVTNTEAYKKGNNIDQEGSFLEQLEHLEVDGVRTPRPYFYHESLKLAALGMETIEGESLSRIVTNQAEFPELAGISVDDYHRSLKNYIEAMHELHIFHGDLFERNVMIDRATLKPRVIDFGKSRLAYFDQDIGGYREGDFEALKRTKRSLELFLKGEKVDLDR